MVEEGKDNKSGGRDYVSFSNLDHSVNSNPPHSDRTCARRTARRGH